MIISIYQIIPELDTDHIKYMDLDFMQCHGYENLPADIYKCVYHGEVPVQDPVSYTHLTLPTIA